MKLERGGVAVAPVVAGRPVLRAALWERAKTKKSRKAEGTGPYGNRLFLCLRDGAVDPSLLRKRRYAGRREA
jgi:hypothetical protein